MSKVTLIKQKLLNFFSCLDPILVISSILLSMYGLLILFSSNFKLNNNNYISPFKQLFFIIFCVIVMVFVSRISFQKFYSAAGIIYAVSLLSLVVVEFVGSSIFGGKRWIDVGFFLIQPAEFFKLAYILAISRYFTRQFTQSKRGPWVIIKTLLWLMPAIFMIYERESDLGTTLVVLSIWFVALILSNMRKLWVVLLIGLCLAVSPIIWNKLEPYQKTRIEVFLNPGIDKLNTGYNVEQAKIAISSGGFMGQGLFSGSQSQLDFLPSQHTDFIFAVLSEKLGFVGIFFLFSLYIILIQRLIKIASNARSDFFASTFVLLYVTVFTFHCIENIGMNLGLLPVAGIPLPFISAGGSNMLMFFIGLGIVNNIASTYPLEAHTTS